MDKVSGYDRHGRSVATKLMQMQILSVVEIVETRPALLVLVKVKRVNYLLPLFSSNI